MLVWGFLGVGVCCGGMGSGMMASYCGILCGRVVLKV